MMLKLVALLLLWQLVLNLVLKLVLKLILKLVDLRLEIPSTLSISVLVWVYNSHSTIPRL